MSVEIEKLGQLLAKSRQEQNLSLKEIENATSIRMSYLKAIEEGRIQKYLSSVYILGFIRQYANFLSLDTEKLVQEYPGVFKSKGQKHEFDYGIGTLEMRGSIGGGVKWFPNLLYAGGGALVLIMAWYFAKFMGIF